MKTIDLTGGHVQLEELLRLAGDDNLILRTREGKEFLLAEVDDFEPEIALIREQPELLALLAERSRSNKTYSTEQVKEILGLD
jgi:hypothetical protein